MCGRYNFTAQESEELRRIARRIAEKNGEGGWRGGEIYPADSAPVLLWEGERAVAELFVWGFPGFQKGRAVINARAETADVRPLFRAPLEARRCAVPASGFYEWDGRRRKYLFRPPDGGALYMAGLWDTFAGERRFCILTTAANDSVADIHSRMPVALPRERVAGWLSDRAAAAELLRAVPPPLARRDESAQTSLW